METFLSTFFGVIAGFIISIGLGMTKSKIFFYSKQAGDKKFFVDKILRKIDRENWEIINTLKMGDYGQFVCKRTIANKMAYEIHRRWRWFKIRKYPIVKGRIKQ